VDGDTVSDPTLARKRISDSTPTARGDTIGSALGMGRARDLIDRAR
jgi:hypothetical protein